jgi:SAM-dependent methyltransferase
MDDKWLYWEATHHLHTYCNPISHDAVDELGGLLELGPDSRVLDIACGHAEVAGRWADRYGCTGIGVDLSPYVLERARRRTDKFEFVLADGAEFETDEKFDVVSCIGASWIWKGYRGTLAAQKGWTKPGGLIVNGEPFWYTRRPPEAGEQENFHTLHECHAIARDLELTTLWMRGATQAEWDRYEMMQAVGVDRWARANPDHEDLAEIREIHEQSKDDYLRWGRAGYGFAVWTFRT